MARLIKSVFNVDETLPITLAEIEAMVRSQEMLDLVMSVRNAPDDVTRKAAKLRLPAFTLCEFDGRIDSDHFKETEYLMFDVDHLGGSVETEKARRKVSEFALFSFISPSGRGIKFAIQMDKPISKANYRYNLKHYRDLLAAESNLDLDPSYHSYHSFLSHTAGFTINTAPKVFPTLDTDAIAVQSDVDPLTIDEDEIRDVCEFLSHRKLGYIEWTACAFALQKIKQGLNYFKLIGREDVSPDHQHRDYEKKFAQCAGNRDINIGTLFWIAHRHGYQRKATYGEKGHFNPFMLKDDGMYYRIPDKPPMRVFGFKYAQILYSINDSSGNMITLKIDKQEIRIPNTALSSPNAFREALQKSLHPAPFLITSTKAGLVYDNLFNFLDRTRQNYLVKHLPGGGKVADGIWNFGSVVCIDGVVVPFDPLISRGGYGFLLEDCRDKLLVRDTPRLKHKLDILHEVYGGAAATALGWAVSNIFYRQTIQECGGFPILFLYGKSSSGKSKLANVILALFGVRSPETSIFRLLLSSGATSTSMNRVKSQATGIPQVFDEYGTSKDSRARDGHFQVLKGLFDGVGKTMAKKTNDNQVWRLDVSSGSVFASVDKDAREEAVNRCVYIDMNGIKDNSEESVNRFQREFMSPRGLEELSAFALHCVYEMNWGIWVDAWRRYCDILGVVSGADSRVVANWAICAAGYSLIRKALKQPVNDDWWLSQVGDTTAFVDEADVIEAFLRYVNKFAVQAKLREVLEVNYINSRRVLIFHLQSLYIEVRKEERLIDDLIHLTQQDLRRRLCAHPDFVREGTHRFSEGQMRAIFIYYDEDEK